MTEGIWFEARPGKAIAMTSSINVVLDFIVPQGSLCPRKASCDKVALSSLINHFLTFLSSVQFNSVQDSKHALGKAHMRSTPSKHS